MKFPRQLLWSTIGFAILFLTAPARSAPRESPTIRGHVYNATNCTGVPHLVVKLTPSSKSQYQSALITNTNEDGDFQIQLQEFGEFYLSIYDGVNQIYGSLTSFRSLSPVLIALKPLASNQQEAAASDCREPALKTGKALTPVAMAISSFGYLYVLDGYGAIIRFSTASPDKGSQVIAKFDPSWQVMDLTLAKIKEGEHLLVTLARGNTGQLMQYSTNGKFEGNWFRYQQFVGVCADETSQAVYMSTSTDTLFQVPFSAPNDTVPQAFFRFINPIQTGALAIDRLSDTLYVADLSTGRIYARDMKGNAVREISDSAGHPSAMSFDTNSKRLFVADASGRKIWTISVAPQVGKPATFAGSDSLKGPSAVAVGPDETVWVGDQSAHAVLHFSSGGHLLKTLK